MVKQISRFEDLEQKYSELEPKIKNTPEKEVVSVLHAMIHELHNNGMHPSSQNGNGSRVTFERIANLYKSAPGMQGAAENEGLPPGIEAPDFTLKNGNNKPVKLSDLRGHNVVLVFYPLDWSPACSDQLSLYQSEITEFDKYDTQLVGISVDSIYSHNAWAEVRGITFPLLADFNPKGNVARKYRVFRETDGFSERALYMIDWKGIIRYQHIAPEIYKIPDIYELFEQLKSITITRESL
jgi:peroxiredoxin